MKVVVYSVAILAMVGGSAIAQPNVVGKSSSILQAHYVDVGNACRKFLNDPACVAAWNDKAAHGYNPKAIQDQEVSDDTPQYNLGSRNSTFNGSSQKKM